MKTCLTIMILFVIILPVCAQTALSSHPNSLREYENFFIRIEKNKNFLINISTGCLTVQRLNKISVNSANYSTGDSEGSISFDNKCFENQKVEINFKFSDGTQEQLKYIVNPRKEEKNDMGC